jgi:AcrR family transcriptional regulator
MATDKNVNKKSEVRRGPSTVRIRRSPEAARDNILAASEAILTEAGPQDLKLTEVARHAAVSAATVLHHFGSIDGVQAALMESMVRKLVARIVAITESGSDQALGIEADIALFDAFEAAGAAKLAAWLVMTGEASRLAVVRQAVDQVAALIEAHMSPAPARAVIEDALLASITAALGAGLFGAPLSLLLGRPAGSARQAIMAALASHFDQVGLG